MMHLLVPLLKLLFAHVLSDFVLQTDTICRKKNSRGRVMLGYQLLHSLIHAVVSYILLADWCNWIVPLVIFLTHLAMDVVKTTRLTKTVGAFLFDQVVHIGVILTLWYVIYCPEGIQADMLLTHLSNPTCWVVAIAYLLILKPTSVFLGLFIKRWTPQDSHGTTLPNAGKTIGYLERILILTFVLIGRFEGVGFLLAAKSIFRFGELSKASEIRTTEYVLIGTLASFTIAILIGLLARMMM